MSMKRMCGVKKGQSVYWFSVFTPGSASLSSEVTALATLMTRADKHTYTHHTHRARSKVIYTSPSSPWAIWTKLVAHVLGKQWMMSGRSQRRQIHIGSTPPQGHRTCMTTLKTLPLIEPFISTVVTIKKKKKKDFKRQIYSKHCAFVDSTVNLKETASTPTTERGISKHGINFLCNNQKLYSMRSVWHLSFPLSSQNRWWW